MNPRPFEVIDLGRRSYHEALEFQRQRRLDRIAGSLPHDALILVEHDPVYTLGRGTLQTSLPVSPDRLRALGAEVIEIERGGDVTWHGPGQLVGYPVIDLTGHRQDLHWYLRSLEQVIIDALAELGIQAHRVEGKTGVWVEGGKIASLGIHVKQWVTLHGYALNVSPDLSWFDHVVPCGIAGVQMTSITRERGGDAPADAWAAARAAVIAAFGHVFGFAHVDGAKPLR